MSLIKFLDLAQEEDSVKRILLSQNSLMRVKGKLDVDEKLDQLKGGNKLIVGKYENETLVSFLSASIWPALPYYSVGHFCVEAKYQTYFSPAKSGLPDMLSFLLEYMEEQKRFTFYFSRATGKKWGMRIKSLETFHSLCPIFERYDYAFEEIIPPNQLSKYEGHSFLIGQKIWPIEIAIIRCTLPSTLRPRL